MSTATDQEQPETPESPSTALERVVGQLRENISDLSYDELLRRLSPAVRSVVAVEVLDVPVPSPLTDAQKAALAKLPLVYGKVCPTEAKLLEPQEVTDLLEERYVLDDVASIVERRKEAIRSIVCNHIDKVHESDEDDLQRDGKGHVLIAEKIRVAGQPKCFSLELRAESPDVTAETLKALADDPAVEDFSHDDYLAMTTPVRVVDEHKVMLELKKNPVLLRAVAQATRPGKTTASLYLRKA